MEVGDKIEAVVVGLELQVLAHRAEIVAYMKPPGWLYAGKDSQVKLLNFYRRGRRVRGTEDGERIAVFCPLSSNFTLRSEHSLRSRLNLFRQP
jgi:hypothetical protein